MSKARIAVVGAGLMGHGIAQVFALAGHEVNITDTVVQNLDTVQSRIARGKCHLYEILTEKSPLPIDEPRESHG